MGARAQARAAASPCEAIGLLRVVDGAVRAPLHRVAADEAGTVVGSLASGPHDVNDVDIDVSRRYLRLWREQGRWLVQGLGLTNGTWLL